MPVTLEQVLSYLMQEEPDYTEAAKLGPDTMPHLEQLATSGDRIVAPRAVYLASLIGVDRAVELLANALKSALADVRVQAAAGVVNLPVNRTTEIILDALNDTNFRVRNIAVKSTKSIFTNGSLPEVLNVKIANLSKSDPEQFIRESSGKLLQQ